MARDLTLLLPGLLGPAPRAWAVSAVGKPRRLTHVECLLGRADRLPGIAGDPTGLFAAFGIAIGNGPDGPTAPFRRLADDPDGDPSGYWVRADPIHLRPDRDRARLFDARFLSIQRAEADALVATFNAHFADDGLILVAPTVDRWYLRPDHPLTWPTLPLEAVVGQPVVGGLPRGDTAGPWATRLNEIQMLFHQAEVKQQRLRTGRPAINGLWLSGGGELPKPPAGPLWGSVRSRSPLAIGLARWSGAPVADMPNGLTDWDLGWQAGSQLLHWDGPQRALGDRDEAAWLAAVDEIEAGLADLFRAVRRGRLGRFELDPGLGIRYRVTRRTEWRLWRRRRTLAEQLDPDDEPDSPRPGRAVARG